jgi:hypothetical protein
VLVRRRSSAPVGSLVVAVVVAWRLALYDVPASTAAMTIPDVVTEDFGQLRLLVPLTRQERCEVLPVSGAAFSLPAISSRLEMEGSEGFFSAGGEGGDWGRARWYGCSGCCVCVCVWRVYVWEGALGGA